MTDCVSREAVLKIVDGWYDNNREVENIEDLIVLITYMQSIQPKSELKNIRAEIMSIGNWRRKSEIPNGYLVQAIEIIDKHIGG